MAGEKAKGGKKGRKHGRNKRKPCAAAYLAAGHREKNKARRLAATNAWHSACGQVRVKCGRVSDVGRRVRQPKRGELAP